MIDDWPKDLLSECYHIDLHHAVAMLGPQKTNSLFLHV